MFAEAFPVEKELDLFAIAMRPHADGLAFFPRPIPVRKNVQDGLRSPPRLIIKESVLGKAARVDNAEMRADTGPVVRRRLAAIIESRPEKSTREKRARRVKIP